MLISDSDLFEVEYANIHIYLDIQDIFEVEYVHDPNVSESTVQEWPTLLQTQADVKQKKKKLEGSAIENTEDQTSKRTP